MHRFLNSLRRTWLVAGALAMTNAAAMAQAQTQSSAAPQSRVTEPLSTSATPSTRGQALPDATVPTAPATDPSAIGHAVLNAGPDPRVKLDGLSRDHAAIFGTDDPDEQALLDQERALQAQREQLRVLERVLNSTPQGADPAPPAMIPLTSSGAPMNMPRLAPTPSGSQLDRAGGDTRQNVDEMQRRVNALRRDADTLRKGGR